MSDFFRMALSFFVGWCWRQVLQFPISIQSLKKLAENNLLITNHSTLLYCVRILVLASLDQLCNRNNAPTLLHYAISKIESKRINYTSGRLKKNMHKGTLARELHHPIPQYNIPLICLVFKTMNRFKSNFLMSSHRASIALRNLCQTNFKCISISFFMF